MFVQALDREWPRRRKVNPFDSDFRYRLDIDCHGGVPVGYGIAVNVPTRFDIEDDVEPGLLPAHIFGRVCGNGDGNAATGCLSLRTGRIIYFYSRHLRHRWGRAAGRYHPTSTAGCCGISL